MKRSALSVGVTMEMVKPVTGDLLPRHEICLQMGRRTNELINGDRAELIERINSVAYAQTVRGDVSAVEDQVIDVVALGEVVQWSAKDWIELFEFSKVATVATPDHCFFGLVRDEIRVHRGQHKHVPTR